MIRSNSLFGVVLSKLGAIQVHFLLCNVQRNYFQFNKEKGEGGAAIFNGAGAGN